MANRGARAEAVSFGADLLVWYDRHKRDLPWRRTSDPYAVWVSEVMLQQTRVAAVIPYYERFLSQFPDVHALATAEEAALLSAWAGLGYYSRARNLQRAAQQITSAKLPPSYDALRALPGFGDYTAAAVASIAFGLPHAAVDGNVVRVLSRIEGRDLDRTEAQVAADTLLERQRPGDFNQAMMELGATLCLPRDPQCLVCPVTAYCKARALGSQNQLPSKKRKPAVVQVERTVAVVRCGTDLLLQRQSDPGKRMHGFWDLPDAAGLPCQGEHAGAFRHSITHHRYTIHVRRIDVRTKRRIAECEWVDLSQPHALPLSTIARKALRLCSVPLL